MNDLAAVPAGLRTIIRVRVPILEVDDHVIAPAWEMCLAVDPHLARDPLSFRAVPELVYSQHPHPELARRHGRWTAVTFDTRLPWMSPIEPTDA